MRKINAHLQYYDTLNNSSIRIDLMLSLSRPYRHQTELACSFTITQPYQVIINIKLLLTDLTMKYVCGQ